MNSVTTATIAAIAMVAGIVTIEIIGEIVTIVGIAINAKIATIGADRGILSQSKNADKVSGAAGRRSLYKRMIRRIRILSHNTFHAYDWSMLPSNENVSRYSSFKDSG